ncbi:RnfABCDGE type electron transport complex subunit D [Pseudooceanicola nanhaiensis]|uniref:RnfABCDGE type electron transport complex subunit D n=1 Tax=Pseudooceanicola nanhaiensis TaxID=375761 RepID=UPI001CD583FA|nr:RnfABCDGE type electron transport complex subunit D [Pseudooceanicola nanhaiensis]MCA0921271.1 RnfABCDGE type electron transport complex subunit D [Pseudooceanicola nanhaiensis]
MNRGLWDRETVAALLLISALPLAVTWLALDGPFGLLRLAVFLVVAGVWHLVWMLARAQPPSLAGALTALALAVLAPEDLGPVALLLSTTFGVVAAELTFGGWGRNVLNPATVTLAFMGFGFPAAPWPDLAIQVGWASWAMLAMGLALGVLPGPVVLGALGTLGLAALTGAPVWAAMPAVCAGLALLVADPVASATTPLGRWLNGALYGGLCTLFLAFWQDAAPVQIAVSSALLASLAAPLFDEISIALWLRRRNRRHG